MSVELNAVAQRVKILQMHAGYMDTFFCGEPEVTSISDYTNKTLQILKSSSAT